MSGSGHRPVTVVVGTDPADVDVRGAVVVVSGPEAGRRAVGHGGLAVVGHPSQLPIRGAASSVVRADGLFGSSPAEDAPVRLAELVRICGDGARIVTSAQIDPGPAGPRTPVDAASLAALVPGEPDVEAFHDRVCRKDWHRLTATVPAR